MLDPIFDVLAGLLAWFYSLVPSYGFAIIALTFVVLIAFTPLTYKSTKSMVAMRRLQPHVKRIQKKHAGDRETMNRETMALYQEHKVSPLSGCLPILIQSPVFIVLFRVVRGITRRSSDIGFRAGEAVHAFAQQATGFTQVDDPDRNFNPEYLTDTSDLYIALKADSEMNWIGIDLARTPLGVLGDASIGTALPYLAMIAIVAVLGWYQQRQIAGRASGEISSQQQMIMRIMPWMLPIFSFTMPAGLVLYFIVSALLRVLQQAYITRSVYGDEELTTPLELDDDDELDDDEDDEPENPLAALFGGPKREPAKAGASRHGSRRPTTENSSARKRTRPPRDTPAPAAEKPKRRSSSVPDDEPKPTGWGRAKRTAPKIETPEKPVSRRVTPKRDTSPNAGRRRKK